MTPHTVRPEARPHVAPPSRALARRSRPMLLATGVVGLALALTACSSSDAATPETSATAEDGGGAPAGDDARGGRTPGVSGEVAAVDGTTAQVQDDESQTAVSWSDDTTITVAVDGTLADVTVGSCVVATTGAMPGTGDATDDTAADDSSSATAARVVVSEPVDGECTGLGGGFGGGGFGDGAPGGDGERPQGAPTDLPTDLPSDLPEMPDGAPTDMPSGAPEDGSGGPREGFGGFGGVTTGTVTAVDGATLTVGTSSPDGESAEETVTVDDATTYTVQRTGTGGDVVVGQCVTAQGESDDSGALAATDLSLSAPGDEGCTSGFGGFGGGQGGPGRGGAGDPEGGDRDA